MLARRIRSRMAEHLSALRISYLRFMGVKIGDKCFVSKDARVDVRRGQVILGDHVFIAGGSYILSHTGRAEETTTTLEDNVIVFVNAVICAGVTVGKNAIVGAGAVVTRDVPPNTTVMGNPARVIAPKGNRPRD